MMTKKDLAKEFSLVVQQEITNHNNAILATNISLEEFRQKLSDIVLKSDQKLAALNSNFVSQSAAISFIKDDVQKAIDKCARDINESSLSTLGTLRGMKKMIDERDTYFLTIDGFKEFEKRVDEYLANLRLAFVLQKDIAVQEFNKISVNFQQRIEQISSEINFQFMKQADSIKDQNRQFDEMAINFSGVFREIEICKKRSFVIEKNIENLYTQIERLKAGKP